MSVGFLFFKTFAFDLLNSKYKNAESVLRAFTFKKGGNKKIMLVAQQLGQWAEQTALKLLKEQNYEWVASNYHSRRGEVDLIVKRGNELIFVEVKARGQGNYGQACEMVTLSKQKKIIKTAMRFLQRYPSYQDFYCRFDVICFDFPQKIAKTVQQDFSKFHYDLQWIENAFTLD
ncbi:UPF0102 protein [Acinetobacter nosocomialis]|jgi:putative endonuclease|uniref:UPF0102 protein AE32_01056 n=2 Tax=Acinetobacter nosocomialis TaxID=106654 RepID=A0A334NA57_ACINO|nr:UPF0102 protein [Acinetobacter sp. RUH 2624]EKF47893.1 UPF0102 protein [Acinetobacter nosocomialis Ab22222]EKU57756.1 TIGR00252 family protein [Acinetobacter nosocomialis]ENV40353.1 UPF0102 protein [Acinetobacter nosocomialis NIPH 386]KDM57760.1 UPF0102 protein [Acinetobacter nosocomialis]